MADENSAPAPAPDTGPTPAAPEASPAPSPSAPATAPADTGSSKESLLDAVLKVVPATTEDGGAAPQDKEAIPEAAPDSHQAEDDSETEPDDDEPASPDLPAATRKKVNKLLKERRELRAELSQLKPTAEIGSELETFAKTNDLSGDDVAHGLQIMAMLRRGDHQAFYQAVAPYVRTAQEVLGVVLPKDLQTQVQQGQMSEAVARDYARQRIQGQRAEIELQNQAAATQRLQRQAVQGDVQRAVSNFETRLSASDPDYRAKAPVVRRVAQGMLLERGNSISSVQEALEISRAAYDEVNKQLRTFQPTPRATHPSPNGASQTPSARATPKTLMEAALQGLDNARRGG